jgi:hypothetical protein
MAWESGPAHEALALHVAQERGIGGQRSEGRLAPDELLEVVVVQLYGPGGVVVVQALHGLAKQRRERGLGAEVSTHAVA